MTTAATRPSIMPPSGGLRALVLLSAGRHPVSGRPAPVIEETQAIALARQLGAAVSGLHAGPDEAPLRDLLGHGLDQITLLRQAAQADPLPALLDAIRRAPPELILAGRRAQGGMDSGTLPYRLAQALGWPIAADISALTLTDSDGEQQLALLQARPRGARRAMTLRLPCVLTVHPAAGRPIPFTFAAARQGRIDIAEAASAASSPAGEKPDPMPPIEERPYRARPRLIAKAGQQAAGQLLTGPAPEEAAKAVIAYLRGIGVLQRPSTTETDRPPHEAGSDPSHPPGR